MRTDVKIGITTGLVVCVGILLYFVFTNNKDTRPVRNRDGDVGLRSDTPPLATPRGEVPRSPLAVASPTPQPVPAPTPAITVSEGNSSVVSTVRPDRPSESTVNVTLHDANKAGDSIVIDPPTAEPNKDVRTGEAVLLPVTPGIREGVRSGEPNATAVAPRTTANEEPGSVMVGAAGEKYYIVKRGDNGLWAVAEKVYGDGKKWELIAAVNPPEVSRNPLRPGQKISLPANAGVAEAPPVRPLASAASTSKPADGEKYVVKSGDTGLEAIARKVYNGDGTLWPAIAKANPNVDSARLRVGQEIIIPSLNDAKRMLGVAATATSRPTTERARSTPTARPTEKPKATDSGKKFD